MRRVHYLIAAAISAPFLAPGAQVVRWNDRPTTTWQDEPPRVRVEIAGARSVAPGSPVLVKFELSDDAYVVVGRVDGSGRLTILYPERPRDRPAVKGNQLHYVRSTRMGLEASFIATDRTRGAMSSRSRASSRWTCRCSRTGTSSASGPTAATRW